MTDPLFCDLVATQQLGERAPIRSRVGSKAMILKSETYHFHRLDLTTMKTGSGWQRRRRSELPSKPSSKRERSSTTRWGPEKIARRIAANGRRWRIF